MKKALISVSDKTGITKFAKGLIELGYEILSTGGTKTALEKAGIEVTQVSDYTKYPEILEGRVKTLHPLIHGGILAKRDDHTHVENTKTHNIDMIDMVVVNLYPFETVINQADVAYETAIENIDIGGPAMLRSAAKNHAYVTVIADSNDYDEILQALKLHGDTTIETRKRLAQKVFKHTSNYDLVIANYLSGDEEILSHWKRHKTLRYGENPHQKAVLYKTHEDPYSIFEATVISGKELSYNNVQDLNAALTILSEFDEPTAVAVKHMNPCGVGTGTTLEEAYDKAYSSDEMSIFGGIVAFNREIDQALATKLNAIFLEIVIAPNFTDEALSILTKKKNVRVVRLTCTSSTTQKQITSINGGVLVQDVDHETVTETDLQVVTTRKPTKEDIQELLFAWKVVKHVKSNAIVVTNNQQTVGVGAGQMNRVGAAKIALEAAKNNRVSSNIYLASDAFFPFDDVVKLANDYGVKAIIQPGGSLKDRKSIDACNALGLMMVFTNVRHFKH